MPRIHDAISALGAVFTIAGIWLFSVDGHAPSQIRAAPSPPVRAEAYSQADIARFFALSDLPPRAMAAAPASYRQSQSAFRDVKFLGFAKADAGLIVLFAVEGRTAFLEIGDELQGHQLQAVSDRYALFSKGGQIVEMSLGQ